MATKAGAPYPSPSKPTPKSKPKPKTAPVVEETVENADDSE